MKLTINLAIITLLSVQIANSQDSLTVEQLKPFSYTFDVIDGKLRGEGQVFLEQEMGKAQFTMIGEYHGSKRISEFTNAIIPVLNNLNYKTMVLEVGPITGKQLNNLEGDVETQINQLHQRYLMLDADGDECLPFPFFSYKEDAQFLKTAKDRSWHVFGIDQEYYDGYIMLIENMFENLPVSLKKKYKALHAKMVLQLKEFYKDDQNDKQNLHVALSNSDLYKDYMQVMANEPKNIEIIKALEESSAIYMLNNQRQWYKNNATRIAYMKSQLRKGLTRINFDLSKDKLLIKMGGYHLSKGFSPLSLYEVGNTLNEIAEFHGNTALNIGFISRFSMQEEKVIDNLNSKNKYFKNHKELLQMGLKDQWVVIDLRKLIEGYFYYPKRFNLNPQLVKLVQRYDLLVIPKIEIEGIVNYN